MVYNDGTDDEKDVKDTENIRRTYYNLMFRQRYNVVGSDISDELGDLLKYYDYDCDQLDQLNISVESEKTSIRDMVFHVSLIGWLIDTILLSIGSCLNDVGKLNIANWIVVLSIVVWIVLLLSMTIIANLDEK